MASRRRSLKTKLNTKLIIDSLIASVIVQQAPGLLNNFLFKSNPLTGYTLTAASAGLGYLAGSLFDRPDVSSISIALAASDIVNGLVAGLLTDKGTVSDFISLPAYNSNHGLSEYTNNNDLTPMSVINQSYN